jgi:prepilin-type N-terminal cleavage/methylation domain-containing protein
MNIYKYKNQKGFTLVEMLVSVALFSIVMTIATSTIFSIIAGNRKAQAINSVVNNLNFAIESMIRDIKTGYSYECGAYTMPITKNDPGFTCVTPSTFVDKIAFISTLSGTPEAVEYKFVPKNGTTQGHILYTQSNTASYPLTSSDINITSVKFYINNPGVVNASTIPANVVQPSVFLVIDAEAADSGTNDKRVTNYHIQTFISQRHLNI